MIELETARVRLRYHSAVAAAVRRAFNLELTPNGYRTLPRRRMMEQCVRVPMDAEAVHVLRDDDRRGTSVVEVVDQRGVTRQIEVPKIAIQRWYRKRKGQS
jgi:hypothetical protein